MEQYYHRESLKYYAGEKLIDAFPEDAYQVIKNNLSME